MWEARLAGRPCDARRLPDGRTLVALHKANRIVEVDEEGSEVWAVENLPDPQAVQRLPNGNTLVALTVPGIVREIDPAGNEVWVRKGFEVLVDAQRLPDGRTLLLEQNGTRIELDADGNEVSRTDGVSSSRLLAY
jgi:glucose/arabinose dehydrogenase